MPEEKDKECPRLDYEQLGVSLDDVYNGIGEVMDALSDYEFKEKSAKDSNDQLMEIAERDWSELYRAQKVIEKYNKDIERWQRE